LHDAALHDVPLEQEPAPEQEMRQSEPLQFTFSWHEFRPEQVTVLPFA
jgi:hypothetical protein